MRLPYGTVDMVDGDIGQYFQNWKGVLRGWFPLWTFHQFAAIEPNFGPIASFLLLPTVFTAGQNALHHSLASNSLYNQF
jgi:hypothetical protein